MPARQWLLGFVASSLCTGCLGDARLPLVSGGSGNAPIIQTPPPPKAPVGSQASAARVNQVGQKLLAANRECGLRPVFHTIGAPSPEIFHRGVTDLFVTEGLVQACQTEGQLAAVLALELGKMVAEREALAGPSVRQPDRMPPQDVRIAPEVGGTFGPADGTNLAERVNFERNSGRGPRASNPLALPEPSVLAKSYLEKSGYPGKELEQALPILKQARGNMELERQLIRPAPRRMDSAQP